jgi:uncharacterized membrane protein
LRPFHHIHGWKVARLFSPEIEGWIASIGLLFLEDRDMAQKIGLTLSTHVITRFKKRVIVLAIFPASTLILSKR